MRHDFREHADAEWRRGVERNTMTSQEWDSAVDSRTKELNQLRAAAGGDSFRDQDKGRATQLLGELQVLQDLPDPGHDVVRHPHSGRPGDSNAIRPAGSMWSAMQQARFDPGSYGRVQVPAGTLWGATTYTAPDALVAPRRVGQIFLGADRRFVYPALMTDGVGPTDTAVDAVRQDSRTLADPATMQRAIDATTSKPETANHVELVHTELKQVAHKISGIPNIIFRQPGIRNVIDGDLRLGLAEALDDMAVTEISGAGLTAGGTGANLATRIRKAVTVVEAAGYSPDTVALSPSDSEALDLELLALQNSTGVLPNWGLQVRVGKSVTTGFVFDSQAFGTLHASPIEVANFEQNDGATNTQLVRAELNAIVTIDQVDAAAALGAAA